MPARAPEACRELLTADQLRLYDLIWKRFVASQMAAAVFDSTTVDTGAFTRGPAPAARDRTPPPTPSAPPAAC